MLVFAKLNSAWISQLDWSHFQCLQPTHTPTQKRLFYIQYCFSAQLKLNPVTRIACVLSKNQLTNYIWAKLSAELDKTNLKLEECSKILASHVNTSLKDVNQDHKDVEE